MTETWQRAMIAFLRKARLWLLRTCVETSVSGSRACIETEMVSNINRRNLVVETVGSALRKRSPTMVSQLQWTPGTRFLEILWSIAVYYNGLETFWTPNIDSGTPDGSYHKSRELWSSCGTLFWIMFLKQIMDTMRALLQEMI